MTKFVFIGLGGGIGAILRYGLSAFTYKFTDGVFPWGTLIVNLCGCFCIGFLWGIFERFVISPEARMFVFVGVLGGFTTFSTMGIETFNLLRDAETKMAFLNVLANNLAGIPLVFAGFAASTLFIKAVH